MRRRNKQVVLTAVVARVQQDQLEQLVLDLEELDLEGLDQWVPLGEQ